jgi:hypothetical protein
MMILRALYQLDVCQLLCFSVYVLGVFVCNFSSFFISFLRYSKTG